MTPFIYDDIPDAPLASQGRVLGIGVFDGVHRGHQAMIGRVRDEARARGVPATLFTFDRLPEEVLRPEHSPRRLMSLAEKLDALAAQSPDEIVVAHVTSRLLAMEPEEFAESILCRLLRPGCVVVGRDWRYGRGRRGSAETLARDASGCRFEVIPMDPVERHGEIVSSTRIRRLLEEGQMARAVDLLSRPYRLSGRIVDGRKLGRTLGYPTANLDVSPERLVPARGIYACRAIGPDFVREAAVSIGVRPTVGDSNQETVEAYLLDYSGDLYGQDLCLDFSIRLRDELRFASVDALKEQMALDVEAVRRHFAAG